MDIEEVKNLKNREALIDISTGKRWFVNGAVTTWVRSPHRVRVPIKHGLYVYSAITEQNMQFFEREGKWALRKS